MPRLILLNGPPGIGKSTLAQIYADDHPGVLNLDIDRVRELIGGWRERFAVTGELARPIALSMAATHLRAGYDVLLPQYLGRLVEIERFETLAHEQGAGFCEVVLMDSKRRSVERFGRRGDIDERPWHRHVQQIVDETGGRAVLADMHDRLTEILRARPDAVVIPSREGAVTPTYRALCSVLDPAP